jgi:hypothetical protein
MSVQGVRAVSKLPGGVAKDHSHSLNHSNSKRKLIRPFTLDQTDLYETFTMLPNLTRPKTSLSTFRDIKRGLQRGLRDQLTPIVSIHTVTQLTGTPKKNILARITQQSDSHSSDAPIIFSALKVNRTGTPIEELFIPLDLAVKLFGFPAIPPPISNLLPAIVIN